MSLYQQTLWLKRPRVDVLTFASQSGGESDREEFEIDLV
jgi:hypothetical protein